MLILCEWVALKARGIRKNARRKGSMKGLMCHLFPFHSSSVEIEEKKKKSSGKLECFTFQICHSNLLILSCLKYHVKNRGVGEAWRKEQGLVEREEMCEEVPVSVGCFFFFKVAKPGMSLSYLDVKAAE